MVIINTILFILLSKKFIIFVTCLISLIVIIILLPLSIEDSENEKENKSNKNIKNEKTEKEKIIKKEDQCPKTSFSILFPIYIKSLSKYLRIKKNKISIYGYLLLEQSNIDNNQKYFLSKIFKNNISNLSQEMFEYYKNKILLKNTIQNKNKDIGVMFIECLASLNCDWNDNKSNNFQNILFNSTNWVLINNLNNEKKENLIVQNYIRYKNEESLENKILLNKEYENNIENFIINKHYEIGIVKSFKCDINKYLITKITKNINDNYYKIFCQGNPFTIKNICKKETIPENFDETIKEYISKNKVILALAVKFVRMKYIKAQTMSRNECENNMTFLGLVILERADYKYKYK